MVDTPATQQVATAGTNVRKFSCGKCRTVLFSEEDLQEHSSEAKMWNTRDNKVSVE